MFSKKEEFESIGNREGDGIWAAGAGSGRDRAGTLPAEGYGEGKCGTAALEPVHLLQSGTGFLF